MGHTAFEHLVKKCEIELGTSVADFKKSKPFETKLNFLLEPGNFPDKLINSKVEMNVGPAKRTQTNGGMGGDSTGF